MKAPAIALALVVFGCSRSNPLFDVDAGTRCVSAADCGAATPVCDAETGTCVQCSAPDDVDACTEAAPVCGDNHACRPCAAHAECDSEACAPDGSCALASNVAYVSSAGTQNAACTHDEPCTTIGAGIATARPFVKLRGTLAETVVIDVARRVTILAEPDASLKPAGNTVPLTVRGTSKVAVFDLTISNGQGPVGVGLRVDAGSPTLELTRVTVSNNALGGIKLAGGSLTLKECAITDNAGNGIFMTGATALMVDTLVARNSGEFGFRVEGDSTVTIDRSTFTRNQEGLNFAGTSLTVEASTFIDNDVRAVATALTTTSAIVRRSMIIGNAGGGMQVRANEIDVSNNFVIRNGSAAGIIGGMFLAASAGKAEHNTVVDNVAPREVVEVEAGGVDCRGAGFPFVGNLIFRNVGSVSATVQVAGTCAFGGSLVLAATSSFDNTPGFANPNTEPFDFHLTTATPMTIRNAAGACTGTDFDGDIRPQDGACDFGADEFVPQP